MILRMAASSASAGGWAKSSWKSHVAAISLLVVFQLPHVVALNCRCTDESAFSDCRHNNWECTHSMLNIKCYVYRRMLNGAIKQTLGCALVGLNPGLCNGAFNNGSKVYKCCDDSDFCNENLNVVLPVELKGNSSSSILPTTASSSPTGSVSILPSIAASPSPTALPPLLPSSSITDPLSSTQSLSFSLSSPITDPPSSTQSLSLLPSSSITAPLSSTTQSPSPSPTANTLACLCNMGSVCSGAQSCETDYMCFRELIYHKEERYTETRFGCVSAASAGVCDGTRNNATRKLVCCGGSHHCNKDLVVSLPSNTSEPQDSPKGSDQLYDILSGAIASVTVVILAVTAIMFVGLCLRYQRDKSKVASLEHLHKNNTVFKQNNDVYTIDSNTGANGVHTNNIISTL